MNSLLLSLLLLGLLTACSGKQSNSANIGAPDTTIIDTLRESSGATVPHKFVDSPETFDTIMGPWHLRAEQFYNGVSYNDTIPGEVVRYANYALRVNIWKAGKPVFANEVITAKQLMGKYYHPMFLLSSPHSFDTTATTCYLELTACEPETDNCLCFLIAFTPGHPVYTYDKPIDYECSEVGNPNYIVDFLVEYFHELSLATPSRPAIKELLNRHCSPELTKRLLEHGLADNPLFGKGTFKRTYFATMDFADCDDANGTFSMIYNCLPDTTRHVLYYKVTPMRKTEDGHDVEQRSVRLLDVSDRPFHP